MERIQLSKNFYLDEFTRSQTASRMGRPIVVLPGSPEFRNLERLCQTVLQPTRDALGAVNPSSGVRPEWLNTIIGGSKTSQHIYGQAADFTVTGHTPYEVCAWLKASGIVFDQLIHEFGRWVHISIAPDGREPRRQVLTAYHHPREDRTVYAPGLHHIKDLLVAA